MKPPETLYVSTSKDAKGLVTRYGIDRAYIGAVRDPSAPNRFKNDPEIVVAIPPNEVRKFGREYRKLIASEVLVERQKAEYEAFITKNETRLLEESKAKDEELAKRDAARAAGADPSKAAKPIDPGTPKKKGE